MVAGEMKWVARHRSAERVKNALKRRVGADVVAGEMKWVARHRSAERVKAGGGCQAREEEEEGKPRQSWAAAFTFWTPSTKLSACDMLVARERACMW